MKDLKTLLQEASVVHQNKLPSPKSSNPNPEMSGKNLLWTEEQKAFLSDAHPKIALLALAGTGKTTLLMEYARRRPHLKWNFLAFNRSVVEQVAKMAPRNIHVRTVHQLAMKNKGLALQHKLHESNTLDWMNAYEKFLRIPNEKLPFDYKKIVFYFMQCYLHEDVSFSVLQSQPGVGFSFLRNAQTFNSQEVQYAIKNKWENIIGDLSRMWEKMIDPSNTLPITHDVYLKLFSLSSFDWDGYWMLDETQDWNGAFYNNFIQKTQNHIVAGDPFQSLYQFRFAMKSWGASSFQNNHWLTQSFRQGLGCEGVINATLQKMHAPVFYKPNEGFHCSLTFEEENEKNLKSFSPEVILAYDHKTLLSLQEKFPNITCAMMTIHAAKGLEFSRVWVCDQHFPAFLSDYEKNALLYVASTRPSHSLRLPDHFHVDKNQNQSLSLTQKIELNWDD